MDLLHMSYLPVGLGKRLLQEGGGSCDYGVWAYVGMSKIPLPVKHNFSWQQLLSVSLLVLAESGSCGAGPAYNGSVHFCVRGNAGPLAAPGYRAVADFWCDMYAPTGLATYVACMHQGDLASHTCSKQ